MKPCPVCASRTAKAFVIRDDIPVHQNTPMPTERSALAVTRGRLEMACCGRCGFVFNAAFDPRLMSYDASYDNSQQFSPTFDQHISQLVDEIVAQRGTSEAIVVEVGCGKGEFLRRLVTHPRSRFHGIGFDPAYVGPGVAADGRLRFERRFYDETASSVAADVVICRHVIEHIAEPLTLLRAVRAAVGDRTALVCFETPAVEWILENRVIWDFFYEHCSLFSAGSIEAAFSSAGFAVCDVRRVFGGQYYWIQSSPTHQASPREPRPGDVPGLADRFGNYESRLRANFHRTLQELRRRRPARVAVWGAGAKGVTFAQLVDPRRDHIACYVDLNPQKQNRFLPGTGHPILAPASLPSKDVDAVVVLNPNYVSEIRADLAGLGMSVPVLDVMASLA